MPREAFEVIVGVSGELGRDEAIAGAGRYLAYADQTDTFGYLADIIDVKVYDTDDGDYGISLQFTTPIENDGARQLFFDELDTLAHVDTYQQLAFEPA